MQEAVKQKKEKIVTEVSKGISDVGYYAIRYIAIITMLIDHLGKILYSTGNLSYDNLILFNMIGRLAFPLFAFELVECFHHTENWKKHLGKIGLLALVSEVPFDMAMILEKPLDFSLSAFDCQNTCFTLFLGFLYLKITNINWNNVMGKLYKSNVLKKITAFFVRVILVALFILISGVIGSDYTWRGILLIVFFDIARQVKFTKVFQFISILLFVMFMGKSVMIYSGVFFVLIPIYIAECRKKTVSGSKISAVLTSRASKKISTFFYPAHLVLLTIAKIILTV